MFLITWGILEYSSLCNLIKCCSKIYLKNKKYIFFLTFLLKIRRVTPSILLGYPPRSQFSHTEAPN